MNIRELLRTEIWSKRTTRKIWVVTGVILVVVGVWSWVNHDWLTPPERKTARTAFTKIDALKHSENLSKEEFKARFAEAKEVVDQAEGEAWTTRDRSTSEHLSLYLDIVQWQRKDQELEASQRFGAQFRNDLRSEQMFTVIMSHTIHAELYD